MKPRTGDYFKTPRSFNWEGETMKKLVLLAACLTFMVTSFGCSTIKGMGEDISTVGGWVTKGSDRVKEGN